MTAKKDVEEVIHEAKTLEASLQAKVKAEQPKVKAEAEKVEAEVVAEVEKVKNYIWADFEAAGVQCPTGDGTIPGYHSLMWHAPNTPQDILNRLGKDYLETK